ncbi:hypothetical protein [Petroclostridium sp. X23]|jgi:hypothetical protein|nr:hypothetical protein [Petroclostridium sp. X23]WHH61065.1 hypothetical protein QKW49_10310 [Petroclostridium sp. X23]
MGLFGDFFNGEGEILFFIILFLLLFYNGYNHNYCDTATASAPEID